MFKGSRNVADGQHHALLAAAGAAGVNGGTSSDWTSYVEQVPSNQLELALWMEADRMGTLLETLDQKKLDNQREVVKNERRESIDNQAYGSSTEILMAAAFPSPHPYHHAILGSLTDLSAASLDDVRQFFRTYYAPNNAVLVMAGDFDLTDAQRLVRKHFAAISRGPAIPPRQRRSAPATPRLRPAAGSPRCKRALASSVHGVPCSDCTRFRLGHGSVTRERAR